MGFRGGLRFKGRLRSGLGFKEWEEEWVIRVEEESWERKEQKERKKLPQGAIFLSSDFRIRAKNGGG